MSVFTETPLDQVQESAVMDGLHQLRSALGSWEVTRAHLHREHAEAVDVHLGALESRITGLRESVYWTAGILCLKSALEVGGAVVGLSQPPSGEGRRRTLALLRSLWVMG